MAQLINNLQKNADRKMTTIMTSEDAEKLGNALQEAKGEVLRKAEDFKGHAQVYLDQAATLFKDKPIYFIGGAAVLGLFAGYLLARPKR